MRILGVSLISLSVLCFGRFLSGRNKKRLQLLKNLTDFFSAVADLSSFCDCSAGALIEKAGRNFNKEEFPFPFLDSRGSSGAFAAFGNLTKEERLLLEEFQSFSRCLSVVQFREKCRLLSENFSRIYLREKAGIAEKNKLILTFGSLGALLIFIILV